MFLVRPLFLARPSCFFLGLRVSLLTPLFSFVLCKQEGLVTYENERNSSDENDHGGNNAPRGPRLGPETSSNALIGLGGAISMVLAGITYLVARH